MYYNLDSKQGQKLMAQMQSELLKFASERGVQGVMNIREIQPEDMGLTAQVITVAASESTYTLQRDLKENCSLVIGGFYVNDTYLREVDVYRGNAKIHNWSLQNIYNMRDKMGVRDDAIFYGPGETLKLVFYPKGTSTAAQSSDVWFIGFVLVPDMNNSATRG